MPDCRVRNPNPGKPSRTPPNGLALVRDEVVYRSAVTWLEEASDRDPINTYRRSTRQAMQRLRPGLRGLWRLLDVLDLECAVTNQSVVDRARELMDRVHLGARDAFHAAHAVEAGRDYIVSSDVDFDSGAALVEGLHSSPGMSSLR